MAVQWDAVLAREVARELDGHLRGTRLRAFCLDSDRRRTTLFTDAGCLEWRLHPNDGGVSLYPARDPFESATLLNAKIRSVDAPTDERIIRIAGRRMRGQDREFVFHVLLATNKRNTFLINTLGVIQDILTPRLTGIDPLGVGRPYSPLGPSARAGAHDRISREEYDVLATSNSGDGLRQLAWLSPMNHPALEGSPDPYVLWRRLAGDEPPEPGLLDFAKGPNPYPVALPGVPRTTADSLLAAFDLCGGTRDSALDPALESLLTEAGKRARRRMGSLVRELERAEDPAVLRSWANLLLTRLPTVPRGVQEASLEGFDGSTTVVPLDPKLSPRENADALYDRAGRASRARDELPQRIAEAQERIDELNEALAALTRGETPDEALVGRIRNVVDSSPRGGGPALPYRLYLSSGGLDIWVGRGSSSNDALTFQHARPNDIWLHARDAAGAHVVLRWTRDGAPPARDLEDAAVLAALHSKARHSGWVPVDWTLRKHVRKPRKAAAGAVIPSRVKTIFVEPNEERGDAMAVRE